MLSCFVKLKFSKLKGKTLVFPLSFENPKQFKINYLLLKKYTFIHCKLCDFDNVENKYNKEFNILKSLTSFKLFKLFGKIYNQIDNYFDAIFDKNITSKGFIIKDKFIDNISNRDYKTILDDYYKNKYLALLN